FNAQRAEKGDEILGLWSIKTEVLHNHQGIFLGFQAQCRSPGQTLDGLVQFLGVILGPWAKDPTTAPEDRGLDAAGPGGTGTLLLFDLPGTSGDLGPFLGLVRPLSLMRQIPLYIKIDGMLIGLYGENIVGKFDLPSCFFSVDI